MVVLVFLSGLSGLNAAVCYSSSLQFLLMLIGWCVIGGWKNENNNLQFLGKNMFGLQQVMSFLKHSD